MKKNVLLLFVLMLLPMVASAEVGDVFSAKTDDGIDMKFIIVDEENKECYVARNMTCDVYNDAIPSDTKGYITIPSKVNNYTVKGIGRYAFYRCYHITEIEIPNSVEVIEGGAFHECKALRKLDIPESVISIGSGAFYESGLRELIIPNSVISPFPGCAWCEGLQNVVIGNGVPSIGRYDFMYCSSLTSVSIGSNVKTIGEKAFYFCQRLSKAEFASIESLCEIDFEPGGNPLGYAKDLYINGEKVTEVIIPSTITKLKGTFGGASNIVSVKMFDSVTELGESTFSGCSSLTNLELSNNITAIGDYCFSSCRSLNSIDIPNKVTSIGNNAFSGCNNIINFDIPNSVECVGDNAFSNCSNVIQIKIGSKISVIGSEAFSYCKNLTDFICLASNIPTTRKDAFSKVDLSNATLYVPEALLESYKSTKPWSEFGKIVSIESSGVEAIDANGASISNYFTLDGQRIEQPRKGVNIVRMNDGTVKKIIIK